MANHQPAGQGETSPATKAQRPSSRHIPKRTDQTGPGAATKEIRQIRERLAGVPVVVLDQGSGRLAGVLAVTGRPDVVAKRVTNGPAARAEGPGWLEAVVPAVDEAVSAHQRVEGHE